MREHWESIIYINYRIAAIVLAIGLLISPINGRTKEHPECLAIEEVRPGNVTCEHPNTILNLFMDVPVTLIRVKNTCDGMVRLYSQELINRRTFNMSTDLKPEQEDEFISCGDAVKLIRSCLPRDEAEECQPAPVVRENVPVN